MRWQCSTLTSEGRRKWRRWFAWYPVRTMGDVSVDGLSHHYEWMWLETVERQRSPYATVNVTYDYRPVTKTA